MVNTVGGWFNYVAVMRLIEQLGGSSALLVSLVLITRFMPSALLFPLAGVVADRRAC